MKTKTQVFNVIILDKSGSMNHVRQAAIDGFNETLGGIKSAQKKFDETQEHYLTLVTFCSCELKTVFDQVPVQEATMLLDKDYEPCCCTPLFDAIGFTVNKMRKHVKQIDDAVVVVTIITDGQENSSREYDGPSIKKLIDDLHHEGWTFTYMGANQDSMEVAFSISIRQARNFEHNDEDTRDKMRRDMKTRHNFYNRVHERKRAVYENACVGCPPPTKDEYVALAEEAFTEEESNNE